MTANQVIYAIYNYLFLQMDRLENSALNRFEYSDFNSEHLIDYLMAKKEIENFKKFSESIFTILRFYEE